MALKVFDPAFLANFDDATQINRIDRQLKLKGQHHDHLIDINEGRYCKESNFHFLLMPFLEAPILEKIIDKVLVNRIWPLISQVASCARFLEELELTHRDIKPANIAVTENFETATLLDLRVVRPLGLSDLTDSTDKRPFVGTARYSPPEFLIREMDDSPESWRAVTFCQLGAVLYDLIVRTLLFADRMQTYQRFVKAVLLEDVEISNDDISAELVRLAKSCLVKDPGKRLRLVSWESFSPKPPTSESIAELKSKISQIRAAQQLRSSPNSKVISNVKLDEHVKSLAEQLKQACLSDTDTFPPVTLNLIPGQDTSNRVFVLSFSESARDRFPFRLPIPVSKNDCRSLAYGKAPALRVSYDVGSQRSRLGCSSRSSASDQAQANQGRKRSTEQTLSGSRQEAQDAARAS